MPSQFGGIPVAEETNPPQPESRFGGVPVLAEETQAQSQFGGVPIAPTPVTPAPEPIAPQEVESNIFREAADIPLQLAGGVTTGVKLVTDIFGADNAVSRSLEGIEGYIDSLLSAQAKADQQEVARIMAEAEDKGLGANVNAALRALATSPLDFIAQGVGTVIPAAAAAIIGGGAGVTAYGITSGVGLVKGAIYDAVNEEMRNQGLSEAEADRIADAAQAYTGDNVDMLALGGALGFLSSRFGVPEAFLKGKIGQKLLESGVEKGVARNIAEGAGREAVPEALQAAQERFAQNLALQREGVDVPLGRGVAGQAVLEGAIGSIIGGGVGAVEAQAADTMRADQGAGKVPEWAPVIRSLARADLAKPEEELFARQEEIRARFGEDAANNYARVLNGQEMVFAQEEEVLLGPGQIEPEPEAEPEWLPAVNEEIAKDLGKSEEEIATKIGEIYADYGRLAATTYARGIQGIQGTEMIVPAVAEEGAVAPMQREEIQAEAALISEREAEQESIQEATSEWLNELEQEQDETVPTEAEEDLEFQEAIEEASKTTAGIELGTITEEELGDEAVAPTLGEFTEEELGNLGVDPEIGDISQAEQAPAAIEGETQEVADVKAETEQPVEIREQTSFLEQGETDAKTRGRPSLKRKTEVQQNLDRMRKAQDNQRNAQRRASQKLTTTLETGEQKILKKKQYASLFPTMEEFTAYAENPQDAYDTEVKGLTLSYAVEGLPQDRAQQKAQREANKKQTAFNQINDELRSLSVRRVEQLADVINIAGNKKLEGKAAHTAAVEALQDPRITPDELERAKQLAKTKKSKEPAGAVPIQELRKGDFEPLTTREIIEGPIDAAATAEQAADILANDTTRTPFERGLARLLRPILRQIGTEFVTITDLSQVPDSVLEYWIDEDGNQLAAGIYDPTENVIYIDSIEGLDPGTILHEMIHAVSLNVIDAVQNNIEVSADARAAVKELELLMERVAQQYQTLLETGRNTPELDKYAESTANFTNVKEFITYGLTGPSLQRMLLNMTPVANSQLGAIRTAFSNFADAIRRLLGFPSRDRSAFEELIDLTGRIAIENVRQAPKRASEVVQAKKKAQEQNKVLIAQAKQTTLRNFMKKSDGLVELTRDPKEGLKQFLAFAKEMNPVTFENMLSALTNNMVTRLADDYKVNAVRIVNAIITNIHGYRNRKLKAIKPNLDKWEKLISDNRKTAELLEDSINLSSLFEVVLYDLDSGKYLSQGQSLRQDNQLNDLKFELQELSKNPSPDAEEQREMNRLAKRITDREKEIEEVFNIFNEMRRGKGGSAASELYAWTMREYRNDLDEHNRLLLESIRKDPELPGAESDTASPKGKLLAEITAAYQEARKRKVYAPLMRYGKYAMRAVVGKRTQAFYMFESKKQRDAFAKEYKKDFPFQEIIPETLTDYNASLRQQIIDGSGKLNEMFNSIDQLKQGNPDAAEELKDNIYQMYLLSLPEGNMRKMYLRRKGRSGFNNDAYRNLVSTKLSSINQLARIKYGKDIRNALSQGEAALEGQPFELDIQQNEKLRGEIPREKKQALLNVTRERATTELTPPRKTGFEAAADRASRLGTKAAFMTLMSSIRSAVIQPLQLGSFGFGTLHAEYGAKKTAAMAGKYIKNFLTMKALSRQEFSEDGEVLDTKGEPAIRNSAYVTNSKIKNQLQKAFDAAEERNAFGGRIYDVMGRASQEQAEIRATAGAKDLTLNKGKRFAEGVLTGAVHHLERISREVFFMSAFELAYEDGLRRGATGDLAVEAAIEKAIELTNNAMFDYSTYNKPLIAKNPLGRMAYQFQNYRVQATGYIVQNFQKAFTASGLTKEEKKQAATRFYDMLGMGLVTGGATGALGYTALVAVIDGVREFLRPDYDDEDADIFYDMANPNNPIGLRGTDLYIRGSLIPRYFGAGSSFAKQFGLEDETADLIAKSIEVGPISGLTDWNFQTSLSLDGLWFSSFGQEPDTWGEAVQQYAFNLFGPFGSVITDAADGAQLIQEGKVSRGMEKILPGLIREPIEAYRLTQEGYVTPSGRVFNDAEYYNTWRVIGQMIGVGSTDLAIAQKGVYGAEQMVKTDPKESKLEIYVKFEKAIKDREQAVKNYGAGSKEAEEAMAKMEEILQEDIARHNYMYFFDPITPDSLTDSMRERLRQDGITVSGFYLGDKVAPFAYPIIKDMLLEPLPSEVKNGQD